MKKTLVGLLAGIIMLIEGMLIGQLFQYFSPALEIEYENPHLFRPWSDPLMSIYYIVPLLTGVIIAWIWDATKSIIKGDSSIIKGFRFGLIYWITTLPGMVMSYSSFPLSLVIVLSWTVINLFQAITAGCLFSLLLKYDDK